MQSTWLDIIEKFDTPELAEELEAQLMNYMHAVERLERDRYGSDRKEIELAKELAMLWFKLKQFIYSRDQRVDDLNSKDFKEAKEIKLGLYPLGVPKLFICLDGRVLSKFFAGLKGNALRTPAGDSSDFVPKRKGNGLFLRNGDFTKMIDDSFKDEDTLFEVFDSHVGCAARGLRAAKKAGSELPDKGLMQDVLRKKEMILALGEYVQTKYKHDSRKKVVAVQTTFDPHNAYLQMGLDKDECLNDPRVKEHGYTDEVLKQLVAEGKILSTQEMVDSAKDSSLRDIFQQNYFELDYEKNYKNSTLNFWQNANKMSESLIPVFEKTLTRIYPNLSRNEKKPELRQLAVLALTNAYNAYLLNHNADGSSKHYAYQHHDESVIAVTHSEKGPFDRARSFSVHPHDPQLSDSIDLMKGLIRSNRIAGRMSETEKTAVAQLYKKPEDYTPNPVPVIFFERLEYFPEESFIQAIRKIDWSDLPDTDWMTMHDEAFEKYLDSKFHGIPASVARKINTMRRRAIKVHKPGLPATEAFLEGRLVPVWLLTDPDRKTIAMFPFMTKGYDEDGMAD